MPPKLYFTVRKVARPASLSAAALGAATLGWVSSYPDFALLTVRYLNDAL